MDAISEELLSAWLRLSNVINNQRLVEGQSFNQAQVCGLLARAQEKGRSLTAGDLCRETRILKSQMNAILSSLERETQILVMALPSTPETLHILNRNRIALLPEGLARYMRSHQRILNLVDRLVAAMGRDKIETLIPLLHQVVDTFDMIQQQEV